MHEFLLECVAHLVHPSASKDASAEGTAVSLDSLGLTQAHSGLLSAALIKGLQHILQTFVDQTFGNLRWAPGVPCELYVALACLGIQSLSCSLSDDFAGQTHATTSISAPLHTLTHMPE